MKIRGRWTYGWSVLALSGLWGVASADMSVRRDTLDGVSVAGGTQAAARIVLPENAGFVKSGAGTLTVDRTQVDTLQDARLHVTAGTLAMTAGAEPTAVTPPAACQQAAFWVNPDSIVTTNGVVAAGETPPAYVSRWCDVRETDTANPTRFYARPDWTQSADYPANAMGIDPVSGTFEGRAGVHFGGPRSGKFMQFYQGAATSSFSNVRHVYAVHAMTNALGCVVGSKGLGARVGPFMVTLDNATRAFSTDYTMMYGRADICPAMSDVGFRLDGRQLDPTATKVRYGWQLWSMDYVGCLPKINTFYYCGFNEGQFFHGAQGGDWIGEVLVFTNRLTEADRVSIERYLLAKWQLPQNRLYRNRTPTVESVLAAGATERIAVSADTVSRPVSFAGLGTVVNEGAGVTMIGPSDAEFGGTFTWTDGSLRLAGGRFPALSVAGGETYAFTGYRGSSSPTMEGDAVSGITCAKQAGAAGTVETTGQGWLRVHTVDPAVRRIKVGCADAALGSVLQLEGRVTQVAKTLAADGAARAFIPNADFEKPVAINEARFERRNFNQGQNWEGWTAVQNTFNILCTQSPRSAGTWSQWMYGNPPPTGTNVLQMVRDVTVSVTNDVPQAGRYELSFQAAARFPGKPAQLFVYFGTSDQTQANMTLLGGFVVAQYQFMTYRFYVDVPSAGTWKILLQTNSYGKDTCVFLDDFDMPRVDPVRVRAEETVLAVPNGGFDIWTEVDGSLSRTCQEYEYTPVYSPTNRAEGWTFTAETSPYGVDGVVGLISPNHAINKGSYMYPYPHWDHIVGGASLFLASTQGTASNTFTVPAGKSGTWRVRARAKMFPTYFYFSATQYDVGLTKKAMVRIRCTTTAGTVDLGTVTAQNQILDVYEWPTTVTLTAGEQVTLSIDQTEQNAIAIVDDLELVREDTREVGNLIANSRLEDGSAVWVAYAREGAPVLKYHTAYIRNYSDRPRYWGYNAFSGAKSLRIQNRAGLYQDITVPQAGLYRLTFHVRTRADSSVYANNILATRISQGSVTNVIAVTPTLYSRNWMEISCLAPISAAGTWRFTFEGNARPDAVAKELAGGSPADQDVFIDDVSLVASRDTIATAPDLPPNVRFEVAQGAQLFLDYTGSAACGPVKYAGNTYVGEISAATHPEFVTGCGKLLSHALGTLLIMR